MPPIQRFRARWVVPIARDPIEDGEVIVEGDRIADVRSRAASTTTGGELRDFGEAAIIPGLVNAHTHLDYTLTRGLLDDLPFFPWVRSLAAISSRIEARDWETSALLGAAEAAAVGVTTVADCSPSGASARALVATGLRGVAYQEVFGIADGPGVEDVIGDLARRVDRLQAIVAGGRVRLGVSPHALYTIRPALLEAVCSWARERGLPLCIHAAESHAETELAASGSGPFAAMLARRGIAWRVPACSPVEHLARHGALGGATLLVHGVQIGADDAARVLSSGAAWAHCPTSNAKLGNGVADLSLLRGPGGEVAVGLGSDSVASNNTMDLLEEMRFAVLAQRAARRDACALTAKEVLHMATLGGARALGMADEIGSLEPGKQADLAVIRLDRAYASPVYDPCSALVYTASGRDVAMALVAGEPVAERGRVLRLGRAGLRRRVREAAARVREAARAACLAGIG